MKSFEDRENDNKFRLKRIYKMSKNAWNDFKEEKREAYQYNLSRQGDNSLAIKRRNQQIMNKLKRSQKQVEEYLAERNHQMMLKQELRKLREEDT